jgi:hypothetical protein
MDMRAKSISVLFVFCGVLSSSVTAILAMRVNSSDTAQDS